MADFTIPITRYTHPTLRRVWDNFRDESNPGAPKDLTGCAIKLMVKRSVFDADALALVNLDATLGIDDLHGVYDLPLTTAMTVMGAGTYIAELRLWESGATPATDVPKDRRQGDYVVSEAVDQP